MGQWRGQAGGSWGQFKGQAAPYPSGEHCHGMSESRGPRKDHSGVGFPKVHKTLGLTDLDLPPGRGADQGTSFS